MAKVNQFRYRPVLFGELLFDCFPDGSCVLGGAPFNVAWHLCAFGADPLLLSAVGRDARGAEILEAMRAWDMDTSGIQVHEAYPTGVVAVTLEHGEPHYDIRRPSAWDHVYHDDLPPLPADMLLYHGSLALREGTSRETLHNIKQEYDGPCYLDLNLRPPFWTDEQYRVCFERLDMLKLNEAELATLLGEASCQSPRDLLQRYRLRLLIVTRGEKGAVALTDDDTAMVEVRNERAANVVDTVGAGDAFSSVCILGQCANWPLRTTLERAQQFASHIVGIRGATVNDPAFYQPFIADWQLTKAVRQSHV